MCAKFGCGPTVVSKKNGEYRQTDRQRKLQLYIVDDNVAGLLCICVFSHRHGTMRFILHVTFVCSWRTVGGDTGRSRADSRVFPLPRNTFFHARSQVSLRHTTWFHCTLGVYCTRVGLLAVHCQKWNRIGLCLRNLLICVQWAMLH